MTIDFDLYVPGYLPVTPIYIIVFLCVYSQI